MATVINILKQAIYEACYSYSEQPTLLEKFENFTEIILSPHPYEVEHPHALTQFGTVSEIIKLDYYFSFGPCVLGFNMCSCGTIFVTMLKDH